MAKICKSCGSEVAENEKFCSSCGAKYVEEQEKRFCNNCGKEMKPNAPFCSNCGAKAIAVGSAAPAAPVIPAPIAPAQPQYQPPVQPAPPVQQIPQVQPQYQQPVQYRQPAQAYQQPYQNVPVPPNVSTAGVGGIVWGVTLLVFAVIMLIWGMVVGIDAELSGTVSSDNINAVSSGIMNSIAGVDAPAATITESTADPFDFEAPDGVKAAVNKNDFDPDDYIVEYTGKLHFEFKDTPLFEEVGIPPEGIAVYNEMSGKDYDVRVDVERFDLIIACPDAPIAKYGGEDIADLFWGADDVVDGVFSEENEDEDDGFMIRDSQKIYFMNDGTLYVKNVMRIEKDGKLEGGMSMVFELIPKS